MIDALNGLIHLRSHFNRCHSSTPVIERSLSSNTFVRVNFCFANISSLLDK